ncbi:AAA family ATPase [bacterium]|nr:AAA family ATPase [bacterium]
MNNLPLQRVLQALTDKGLRFSKQSKGFLAQCPAHDDKNPSLSIAEAPDGRVLMHCQAGCTIESILEALGLKMADLYPERLEPSPKKETIYQYTDEEGNLLSELVRLEGKRFYHRRPDGKGGYTNGLEGVRRVPYRLHELVKAERVIVVEGEKDADRLVKAGMGCVTTFPDGAGAYRSEYQQYFRGKKVIFLSDADRAGVSHSLKASASLNEVAEWLKLVEPFSDAKDVSEWLDKGHSTAELVDRIAGTSDFDPASLPEWTATFLENHQDGKKKRSGSLLNILDTNALLTKAYEPPEWVIPELLPVGLTILAGEPKAGKSWLTLQVSLDVSRGKTTLGAYPTNQGQILYCGLEDSPNRLQTRMHKLLNASEWPKDGDLDFVDAGGLSRIRNGAIEELESWLMSKDNPRLIVIDTYGRIAEDTSGNRSVYLHDVEMLSGLQKLAMKYGVCILCVHHTRKERESTKRTSSVSGSFGLTGTADTIILLETSSPGNGVLRIGGRDVVSVSFQVKLDLTEGGWLIEGDAPPPGLSPTRTDLYRLIEQSEEPMFYTDIAQRLDRHPKTVNRLLNDMVRDGVLCKTDSGSYALPGNRLAG